MNYKRYKAWEFADQLVRSVYRATATFPKSEAFALTSQMRRAALSVPGNIVEGSARKHQKEFLRFLYVALSSLTELAYYIDLAKDLGYLKDGQSGLIQLSQRTARVLQGLISRLERDLKADSRQLTADSQDHSSAGR
ncbi:MAG: four helix bundle protein [Candidatus Methylomirabilales bacterium]